MTSNILGNPAHRAVATARWNVQRNDAITAAELRHALAGLRYPARPWQLVTQAEHNGAGSVLCRQLRALPDRLFRGHQDVHGELGRASGTAYLAG
jgi:hypothetical protein